MNPVAPLWFLYLAGMGWLFQRRTQWLTRFGIFSTLLVAMLVRYGVAVPFSDRVNPQVTGIPITSGQLTSYYVSVALVYVGILAGAWAVDRGWPRRLDLSRLRTDVPSWALAAAAVIVIGVVVVDWVIIPWQSFIGGVNALIPGLHSAAGYRQHRVVYGEDTSYASGLLGYLGSFARFALASALLWILWFHRRRSRLVHILFWVLFLTLAAIGILSGQKLPALMLLVAFGAAYLVERGRPSILNWRFAVAAALFVLVLAPALYFVQYPHLDYWSILQLTVYRLTEEYSRAAQLRWIFYPDRHPFLYGLSSFIIRGAAHLVGIDTSAAHSPETYIPAHSPGAGPDYGGTWNAGFFADAWADFGFVGVVGAALLIGAAVRLIDRWFDASGKGPLELGMYTAACISAIWVSEVATLTALWTYALGSGFLVYGVLLVAARWRRGREASEPARSAVEGST